MKKTKDLHYFEHNGYPKKHDVTETDEFVIIDGFKINYVTGFDYTKITDSAYEVTVTFIARTVED
ncbi:hypothetical protein K1728_01795 [Weissella confusa]|uniref:hypothetical protein n=1 Tax=Weissella confusa TaxID=1583 RepID=UPI001C6F69AE|nr:hypothetical protein [Weissella confusa]QYU58170.1 hypothetical protein K1728_01795 [Weissella confusa]